MLASQLAMGELRAVTDNIIHLAFFAPGETSLQLVQKPDNLSLIHAELRDHYRAALRLKPLLDRQSPSPVTESRGTSFDPEAILKTSARLRWLVEQVNGEIIGYRKTDDTQ